MSIHVNTNVDVNLFAVLLAAIAAMGLGFFWYSPIAFGNIWMKLAGHTKESIKKEQAKMGNLYALSFAVALITAYVLSHVMTLSQNFFHYSRLSTGLNTAFWMWLGFVMPVQLTDMIFGSKNWKLLAINTGYQLTTLVIMAIILAIL